MYILYWRVDLGVDKIYFVLIINFHLTNGMHRISSFCDKFLTGIILQKSHFYTVINKYIFIEYYTGLAMFDIQLEIKMIIIICVLV